MLTDFFCQRKTANIKEDIIKSDNNNNKKEEFEKKFGLG